MKISLLLQREPFQRIFEATMERHLSATTGIAHCVKWQNNVGWLTRISVNNTNCWFCNPHINAIFVNGANRNVFDQSWKNYGGGSASIWRSAKRAYIAAATFTYTQSMFAPYRLTIQPAIDSAANIIITGGNTRLRIFDINRREATTILKEGFAPSLVSSDLGVRQANPWLPAPQVLRILECGKAYVEPILEGDFVETINDFSARNRAFAEAIRICNQLTVGTASQFVLADYLRGILSHVAESSYRLLNHAQDTSHRISKWLSVLNASSLIDRVPEQLMVEVGQTHGDLQPGNILVDLGAITIIDWERTTHRMYGFDSLTLALSSRRNQSGLVTRAIMLADGQFADHSYFESARQALRGSGLAGEVEGRLLLYLAEELKFHLDENTFGPIKIPTIGLSRLLDELESWLSRTTNK